MRLNYVVSGWTGPRRADPVPSLLYLKQHLDVLSKRKFNADQITVALSKFDDNFGEVWLFAQSLNSINGIPVKWLMRENVGMSFGAFSDAYAADRTNFDYYIFMEDDYVFVKDDFDEILIKLIEEYPKCGFMCQLAGNELITNGIARSGALEALFLAHGQIPSYHNRRNRYTGRGQTRFAKSFIEAGFELRDFSDRFKTPFSIYWDNSIKEYSPDQAEYLIKPVQMLVGN